MEAGQSEAPPPRRLDSNDRMAPFGDNCPLRRNPLRPDGLRRDAWRRSGAARGAPTPSLRSAFWRPPCAISRGGAAHRLGLAEPDAARCSRRRRDAARLALGFARVWRHEQAALAAAMFDREAAAPALLSPRRCWVRISFRGGPGRAAQRRDGALGARFGGVRRKSRHSVPFAARLHVAAPGEPE